MDTKQIGETSEAKVLAELKSRGYTVLTAFGDNAKYDLVVDEDGSFTRVQVKTGRVKGNGTIGFKTSTIGHNTTEGTYQKNYDESQIDIFVVYCPEVNEYYAVDINDAPKSQMSLRIEPPKNNQTKGVNLAEDFSLTERFK